MANTKQPSESEQNQVLPLCGVVESDVVITVTGVDIQLIKRQWWQVYKSGWHKHVDLWGKLYWIRYQCK